MRKYLGCVLVKNLMKEWILRAHEIAKSYARKPIPHVLCNLCAQYQ